jgi:hypothetical protein
MPLPGWGAFAQELPTQIFAGGLGTAATDCWGTLNASAAASDNKPDTRVELTDIDDFL